MRIRLLLAVLCIVAFFVVGLSLTAAQGGCEKHCPFSPTPEIYVKPWPSVTPEIYIRPEPSPRPGIYIVPGRRKR